MFWLSITGHFTVHMFLRALFGIQIELLLLSPGPQQLGQAVAEGVRDDPGEPGQAVPGR